MKNEGNLEELLSSLDKIVEEAKDREEPAWYGWPGVGVTLLRGQQVAPGPCLGVLLASCCKGGCESCRVFTAMSLGLKHTKISLIRASLGLGSMSIYFLSAGRSVSLRCGDKPMLTNPKGRCFGAQHLSNSRAPLGALCVPGLRPQQTLQVLFGHPGDRRRTVSRNTTILYFCAEGVNDILPAPGIHLQPALGKGSLFPPVGLWLCSIPCARGNCGSHRADSSSSASAWAAWG